MALGIDDDPTHPFNFLTPRERAILYSNRCVAFVKISDLGQAFADAMACIRVDCTFPKGYWRAASVLKQMGREEKALETLITHYPTICGSDGKAFYNRVDFVYEITILTDQLWDKWRESQPLFRHLDVHTSIWTEVVQRLAKNKKYHGLHLVFLQGCTQPGKPYDIGKGGVATGCNTSDLDLQTTVCDLSSANNSWSMPLVLELLKHGSKVEGLSQKEGDTPLHCAVENALKTGWVDLLEYLLSKVFTMSEQRNLPDHFGDSLFHLVAKTTGPYCHAKTVVDVLWKYRVDPSRKDQQGCMPLDVVPMSSPHFTKIHKLLTETAEQFMGQNQQLFQQQKPNCKQEEMMEQMQKEEQLMQERLRKEQERRQQEELEARRQQLLEEQQRQEKEEQEQQKRIQEEKRQKEEERLEKLRRQQEEKKKEIQKKKEEKEMQKKRETEVNLRIYHKGLTFQKQGKHYQAVPLFLEFISKEHKNVVIYQDLNRCKDALVESLEHCQKIPNSIKFKPPRTYWNMMVQELANKSKWWSMFLLLVGQSYRTNQNSKGIAHGCDASGVSIVAFLSQWKGLDMDPDQLTMVKALLKNKAKPDGLLNDAITPLAHCLKTENYELVNLLLTHGASPKLLVMDHGDTPLHSALKIGFKQKDRKFTILELLLTKYSRKPKSTTYLDKNAKDGAGNTLFHLALTCKPQNLSFSAVQILTQHKVNPCIQNNEGMVPLKMVTDKDRRHKYLAEAEKYYNMGSKSVPSVSRGVDQHSSSDGTPAPGVPDNWSKADGESRQQAHHNQSKKARPTEKKSQREKLQEEVEQLISAMPKFIPNEAKKEIRPAAETSVGPDTTLQRTEPQQAEEVPQEVNSKGGKPDERDKDMGSEEEEEDEEMEAIDATIFDNLAWEVECTAKVWKFLHDRQVPNKLKETAIRKIQMLGSGDWRGRLCKPLEGPPKQHNMKLYEARLTKGGRILWEVAIAFSPRCSEESEKRLASVAGGTVYSEIIRIWDIVTDHKKLIHAINVIVKSVERGEECIIRKNLVGFSKKSTTEATMGNRLPTYFHEITNNSSKHSSKPPDNAKKITKPYFPPASSRENEYHIMKFYSVNSTLVNAMLNDNDVKVDFPFCVTELEHAIINLQPRPASSILLLGRSGTGKTTCCLYRMWTKFFKYWQQVSMTGEPLIPRDIAFIHQDKPDEDPDKSAPEPESSSASNITSRAESCSAWCNYSCDSKSGEGPRSSTGDADGKTVMDHLHQIFITKNKVLCREVQRNFCEMSHACEFAAEPLAQQDTPIPDRFQDAHQARFPLFLTPHQFLLILDASLPNPYFPREANGTLKRKIQGWDNEDGLLTSTLLMEEEDEEDEDDASVPPDDEIKAQGLGAGVAYPHRPRKEQQGARCGASGAQYDPRREVTYEVFAFELWPRINKKKLLYHPTLVWMEITSFIKGSVEALHTDSGHLSLESYLALGQKRASNFTANREEIYNLFKTYEHLKSQKGLFDEGDLVFHIYRRLQHVQMLNWVLHEIYVDETQDFTQAELALLIRCAHDPNSLFLTGDTAQSIMRGVAFRFDDLKSLFHYASKSVKALGKHSAVTVPKKVYQLTHNYRSHAGILKLASTIVDLMTHFFPNSFDHLERDQGLFHGPSPVLLESCSFSDLALLLRGSKRKTSKIEFGAHQVILVTNEEAIKRLPAELRLGLVMTICEAKGLEFDDVLLYNFFKDSPAEWRVITGYTNELIDQQRCQSAKQQKGLKEIEVESLTSTSRPRPLKFDPDEHKVRIITGHN
ncbi:TPR and ankyrin repeat-containing protein 1-like isoform X2 [Acanthaster planci]|nr:TPR and ankyrin repeat-containing protein 1-like isoform X2 [Acanthaster planci]XP_022098422.1 TPR and ankyrin repeat-containing protein 1-like isoform X2 [Acanthaster planci]XP_022098423.1 TPR and ankyrin repeat-containing protein 1-like isoform X2 [Acanthaster planci]